MLRTLVVVEPGPVLQIDDQDGVISNTGETNTPPYAAQVAIAINTPGVSSGNTQSTALVSGNLPVATGALTQTDSGIVASNVALKTSLPVTSLHTVTFSSTPTFDFTPTANGLRQKMVLTGGITPTLQGSTAGDQVMLDLVQDSTGSHGATWPSNVSAQTPQPNGTPSTSTLFVFMYDGAKYLFVAAVGGQ